MSKVDAHQVLDSIAFVLVCFDSQTARKHNIILNRHRQTDRTERPINSQSHTTPHIAVEIYLSRNAELTQKSNNNNHKANNQAQPRSTSSR